MEIKGQRGWAVTQLASAESEPSGTRLHQFILPPTLCFWTRRFSRKARGASPQEIHHPLAILTPAAPIEVASSQPPRQKALMVDSWNRSCRSSEENRGQEGKSLRRLTCHLRTQPQAPTSRASHHTGHRWLGLETRTVLSVSHPVFTEPENTHF